MPLGVRDLLLVVRAKDQATRTIAQVGAAYGSLGKEAALAHRNVGSAVADATRNHRLLGSEVEVSRAKAVQATSAMSSGLAEYDARIQQVQNRIRTGDTEQAKRATTTLNRLERERAAFAANSAAEINAANQRVTAHTQVQAAATRADQVAIQAARSQAAAADAALNHANAMQARGTAMLGIGAVMAGMGAIGVAAFGMMAKAAIDYNKEATMTLTQTERGTASLEQLKRVGINVASAIPAPFREMQNSLYDIFSSMDVGLKGSEVLLKGFAKTAVAGQVDMETAGRATISVMNAWGLGTKDLNRVLDVQFQLVKYGRGTYEEFAKTIGRSIPAARGAGQEIESLAGMLAFLTRNGLSTAMASTSAARAIELLAKPEVIQRLENMGVKVRDASGNMLQMNEIITQLAANQGWATMSSVERGELFKRIFGTGTIQARRFFDLAIPNFMALNDLTNKMRDSGGALEQAFSKMAETPAMRIQALKNQFEILQVQLGDAVVPALMKLVSGLTAVLEYFNKLSPEVRSFIASAGLILAILTALIGIVVAAAGAFLVLHSALLKIGVSSKGAVTGLVNFSSKLGIIGAAAAVAIYGISKMNDKIEMSAEALARFASGSEKDIGRALGNLNKLGLTGEMLDENFRKIAEASEASAEKVIAAGEAQGLNMSKYRGVLDEVRGAHFEAAKAASAHSEEETQAAAAIAQGGEAAAGAMDRVIALTNQQKLFQQSMVDVTDGAEVYKTAVLDKMEVERAAMGALDLTTEEGKKAWKEFSTSVSLDLDEYNKALEEQIAKNRDWSENFKAIYTQLSPEVALILAGMGAEGKTIAEKMANDITGEGRRTADLLLELGRQGGTDYTRSLFSGMDPSDDNTRMQMESILRIVQDLIGAQLPANTKSYADTITRLFLQGVDPSIPGTTERMAAVKNTLADQLSQAHGITRQSAENTVGSWLERLRGATGPTGDISGDWVETLVSMLNELMNGVGKPRIQFTRNFGRWLSRAKGGPIPGYGGGDRIPALLEAGEFVVNKDSTRRHRAALEHINVQKYATGGYVKDELGIPLPPNFGEWGDKIGYSARNANYSAYERVKPKIKELQDEKKRQEEAAAGALGSGAIGSGRWQEITKYLSSIGEPYTVTSSYRPGSITRSGNLSLHALGRAVDLVSGNMMSIFNKLLQVGGSLAELIYSPAGFSIKNGQKVGAYAVADHYDHVHAAVMDAGGVLAPGLNAIWNGTGSNESLIPIEQMRRAFMQVESKLDKVTSLATPPSSGFQTSSSGPTLTINEGAIKVEVTASEGMSAEDVAEAVGDEIEKKFRELLMTLGTM